MIINPLTDPRWRNHCAETERLVDTRSMGGSVCRFSRARADRVRFAEMKG
jgi:hypothetical protein